MSRKAGIKIKKPVLRSVFFTNNEQGATTHAP